MATKNDNNSQNNASPVGAALAGAAAGALAGAAAAVMMDPKKREEVVRKTEELIEKGKAGVDKATEKMHNLPAGGKDLAEKALDAAKHKISGDNEEEEKGKKGGRSRTSAKK